MATPEKRTIVLAMDESEHSDIAYDWYVKNLMREGDYLVLVHCMERKNGLHNALGSADIQSVCSLLDQEENDYKKMLAKLDLLLKNTKLPGKVRSSAGRPAEVIMKAIEEEKADHVVCGSRGVGKIRRTILGSCSEYVLHHAHVPVTICRHESLHHHHHHNKHAHTDSKEDVNQNVPHPK